MTNTSLIPAGPACPVRGTRNTRDRLGHAAGAALFACLTAILGGCAGAPSNSVIVGSVPKDYRTTHPIIVSEEEQTLDVPVASSDRRLLVSVRDMIGGFAQKYHHSASGIVRVMLPRNSVNAGAANFVSGQVRHVLVADGIPSSRIVTVAYDAGGADNAPIRIAFTAMTAHTTPCGRWPADLTDQANNENYENFGCASQNNLAAQVANPSDLLAPRAMTPIDSERRTTVYGDYVNLGSGAGAADIPSISTGSGN